MKNGLSILLFVFVVGGCRKSGEETKTTAFNYSPLTQFNWLNTPRPDTARMVVLRNQTLYLDEIIITDTVKLEYRQDSSWKYHRYSTEVKTLGTTPYTGMPFNSYLPHGQSLYEGSFSLSTADTLVTTHVVATGATFPPVVHKIKLLTNDSLKLWHPQEGISSFYATPK